MGKYWLLPGKLIKAWKSKRDPRHRKGGCKPSFDPSGVLVRCILVAHMAISSNGLEVLLAIVLLMDGEWWWLSESC